MKLRGVVTALLGVLGLSVAGVIIVYTTMGVAKAPFGLELSKALMQISTVSVIGAAVSLLTAEFQRRRANNDKERDVLRQANDKERDLLRQAAEGRAEFLTQMLTKVTDSYVAAKRARRLLRARGLVPPYENTIAPDTLVFRDEYDACLEAVNDAQLELETASDEAETNASAFTQSRQLVDAITTMEKYLGKLVTEYEQKRGRFAGDPPVLPLEQLAHLRDFVGPYTGSHFAARLKGGFTSARGLIRHDLLHPERTDSVVRSADSTLRDQRPTPLSGS